jgi:chaperone required for assembly of F1-ATPase
MSEWKAKRFWQSTQVQSDEGGLVIALDGRPVKTPAKRLLCVPSRGLAQAIAAEWEAQTDRIDPLSMPCTRTANAAIDKVAPQHGEVADMLAAYGDSDLLCYRAQTPAELVERQNAQWNPVLDWAEAELGVRLIPRQGIMHQSQAPGALEHLSQQVHGLTAFELAAFHDLVSLSGSLILGFAAMRDARTPGEIWEISRVDENWQSEQWGKDDEAEAQSALKREAFFHAKRFFDLLHAE